MSKGTQAPLMQDMHRLEGWEGWDAYQISEYFKEHGLGDYSELLLQHKITGEVVPLLSDQDLKDIGITIVGDRLRFKHHIKNLQMKRRKDRRTRVVWEAEEPLYYNLFDHCLTTCCFLCPEDPSKYTLTTHHLKIKKVDQLKVCGMRICGCCTKSYEQNNIDLTQIIDTDLSAFPPPCWAALCCAEGRANLVIATNNNETVIVELKRSEGPKAVEAIMQQVEENQIIVREST